MESFSKDILRQRERTSLPEGKTQSVAFHSAVYEDSGIRWIRAKVQAGDRTLSELSSSFAVIDLAKHKRSYEPGDFILGITYGASPDNLSPIAAAKSATIDITMLRSNPRWNWTQPKADQ